MRSTGRVICLLPARNCQADLPGWFESVEHFADGAVALDDGSTDGTREALERSSFVKRLIRNPRRPGYLGWDDATNRRRLLEAAGDLEPDWIISIDADERIAADDAHVLRDSLRHGRSGCAYCFTVFRMSESLTHYDRADLWVARLFAYQAGQTFAGQGLHQFPVPSSIPADRYLKTTIRIQHIGGATPARRRARYRKYRQADPTNRYQADYSELLRGPTEMNRWRARPPGLPPLLDEVAPIRWELQPEAAVGA